MLFYCALWVVVIILISNIINFITIDLAKIVDIEFKISKIWLLVIKLSIELIINYAVALATLVVITYFSLYVSFNSKYETQNAHAFIAFIIANQII